MTDDPRVVAFGGGTGLPVLLSGLPERVADDRIAVVTVTDDAGSSGRLRHELGIAPPDVRNGLVALAGRRRLAEVFDYRFETGAELRDHTVGNIVIAALTNLSGGFREGIQQAAACDEGRRGPRARRLPPIRRPVQQSLRSAR